MSTCIDSSEDDGTQSEVVDCRQQILATELPERVLARIRGRSRVAVRNVGDLMLYLSIIEPLCLTFQHYKDHELAIGELLHITSNRLIEWRRVWNLARKKGAFRDNMSFVYQHLETSISEFVALLNAMESI